MSGSGWASRQRSRKLEEAAFDGVGAVFINPRRTAVGMNLIAYPSIHFFQFDNALQVVEQAKMRSWRPQQTEDVEINFDCVRGTYEPRTMTRHAMKQFSALTLRGEDTDTALIDAASLGARSLLHDIIADVARADETDLAALFEQYNRAVAETLRPQEFITGDGNAIETRDASDSVERKLEEVLLASYTNELQAAPQLTLF